MEPEDKKVIKVEIVNRENGTRLDRLGTLLQNIGLIFLAGATASDVFNKNVSNSFVYGICGAAIFLIVGVILTEINRSDK